MTEGAIGLAIEAYNNGIKEAQRTIEALQKFVEELQKECPHNYMMPQTRAWAPGHFVEGQVCEICGHWEADKKDFEGIITTNFTEGETFTIDMSKKEELKN